MSFSKKLALTVLCITPTVQANKLEEFIQKIRETRKDLTELTRDGIGNTKPCTEYLNLTKKVLQGAGINPHAVEIRETNLESTQHAAMPVFNFGNTLFLDSEKLDTLSYSEKVTTLGTEVSHLKHNDLERVFCASLGATALTIGTVSKALKKVGRARWIAALGTAFGITPKITHALYTQTIGKRADREGLEVSGCHTCIQESIPYRLKNLNPENSTTIRYYLSEQELNNIANKYSGKTCHHHAQKNK